MNRNAKRELTDFLNTVPLKIKCAKISYESTNEEKPLSLHLLSRDYTQEKFINFLVSLDFDYEEGYGMQEIHGIIWFENNTWASREEHGDCEYWQHNSCPVIPEELESVTNKINLSIPSLNGYTCPSCSKRSEEKEIFYQTPSIFYETPDSHCEWTEYHKCKSCETLYFLINGT